MLVIEQLLLANTSWWLVTTCCLVFSLLGLDYNWCEGWCQCEWMLVACVTCAPVVRSQVPACHSAHDPSHVMCHSSESWKWFLCSVQQQAGRGHGVLWQRSSSVSQCHFKTNLCLTGNKEHDMPCSHERWHLWKCKSSEDAGPGQVPPVQSIPVIILRSIHIMADVSWQHAQCI